MQIGSEMAALQEKTPKMDPKKRFFWKIPQDFELLKQVPQNSHQTSHFGWNRYIGTWNLSHGAFQGDVKGMRNIFKRRHPFILLLQTLNHMQPLYIILDGFVNCTFEIIFLWMMKTSSKTAKIRNKQLFVLGIHSFIHPLLDLLKSTTTKTNKDLLRLWVGWREQNLQSIDYL